MATHTLKPIAGARWAIGRTCFNEDFLALIENTPIANESEASSVLQTLGFACTEALLNQYFPKNTKGQRCPTFALMSHWYDLSPANATDAANRV